MKSDARIIPKYLNVFTLSRLQSNIDTDIGGNICQFSMALDQHGLRYQISAKNLAKYQLSVEIRDYHLT